ncbi:MAG: hypothetical protein JW855_00175 [Gammaproteobacteria bacterium]|nr:hypothetical protein [Gammaproteobacteria bacterium]
MDFNFIVAFLKAILTKLAKPITRFFKRPVPKDPFLLELFERYEYEDPEINDGDNKQNIMSKNTHSNILTNLTGVRYHLLQ